LLDFFVITKEEQYDGEKKSSTLARIKELYPTEEIYYMVGDTVGDLEAAIEAGYDFIEASFGYGEFKEKNEMAIMNMEDILVVMQ